MSGSQPVALGALLVAASLWIVGCAAAPEPTEPPAAAPGASESAPPAPEQPVATLPLGCADLLSLDAVQAQVPGETLTVAVDETSVPSGPDRIAFATAGGLRCVWGGPGRTDGGYDVGLELSILGNASEDFADWTISPDLPGVTWQQDAFGDRSITYCDADWQNGCYGAVLVGDYWIDVSLRDAVARSAAVATDRLGDLLNPVIEGVRAAGAPNPAWSPPPGSLDGQELCTSSEVPSSVVGGEVAVTDQPDGGDGQSGVAERRVDAPWCVWSSSVAGFQDIRVWVWPGGDWVFSRMEAEPGEAAGGYLSEAVPVEIPGADGTLTAQADQAWAAMRIGGSLIVLSNSSTYEASDNLPLLERLAAALRS